MSLLNPTRMSFKLIDVSVGPSLTSLTIGGTEYGVSDQGKLVNLNGREQTVIRKLRNGSIAWKEKDYRDRIRNYEGTISINR